MAGYGYGYAHAHGIVHVGSNVNPGTAPTITAEAASSVIDGSFTVGATVNPNGLETTVFIDYGLTTAYGSTQATVSGSPLTVTGAISGALTGLEPDTLYYWRVRATNSAGTTYATGSTTTSVPLEILDGNWWGKYEYNHASNVVDGSNLVSQLRDLQQNNAESAELVTNGDFGSDVGWTLGTGWSVTGGKAVGVAGTSSLLTQAIGVGNGVYNIRQTIDSISGGGTITNSGLTPQKPKSVPGQYSGNGVASSANLGISKQSVVNCQIDDISIKRVLGQHLIHTTASAQPLKTADYIEFDGVDDNLKTAVLGGGIGTIYIIGQRVGTDPAIDAFNSLTGFGSYTSSALWIGYNFTSFLNIRIKAIYVRSAGITDSAGTISKINTWLKKKFDLIMAAEDYGATPNATTDNHAVLQSLLDAGSYKQITLGTSRNDVYYISKPLNITQDHINFKINGTLKLTDGLVRPLVQNATIGTRVIYVDNADQYFKAGQFVSVSADNMPTGGGGSVARKVGECSEIESVNGTSVTLKYNLIGTIQGKPITDLLVSNNAKIGHTQSVLMIVGVDDVTISGGGLIDGNYPTMYNVHPNTIQPGYFLLGYEDSRAGNGIVAWEVTNLNIDNIKVQETNIAGMTMYKVDGFAISNFETYHTFMKCLATTTIIRNGTMTDLNLHDSYNEDGLCFHDDTSYVDVENVIISNVTRSGLLVGAGSNYNTFTNIQITNGGSLPVYLNSGTTSAACHDNTFTDITVNGGYSMVGLTKCYNYIFNNLVINAPQSNGAQLSISGEVHDITFNGGGIYNSKNVTNAYPSARFFPKGSYATELAAITFNNFHINNNRTALANTSACAAGAIVFNDSEFLTNTSNGDVSNPGYTFNNCQF